MSKTEIFTALNLIRRTVIQAHVQINDALDQLEKLTLLVQNDVATEVKAQNDR